jgi:hypothetical protein
VCYTNKLFRYRELCVIGLEIFCNKKYNKTMEIINRINDIKGDYWVSVDKIILKNNNIHINFILKINETKENFTIIFEDVIEYLITDVNGGGINILNGNEHLALKQYLDDYYMLRINTKSDFNKILYELYKIHTKKFSDWIPFEKYFIVKNLFGKSNINIKIYNGPEFIIREYIKIFDKNKIEYKLEKTKFNKYLNVSMVHFGESYIIANNIYEKNNRNKASPTTHNRSVCASPQ